MNTPTFFKWWLYLIIVFTGAIIGTIIGLAICELIGIISSGGIG